MLLHHLPKLQELLDGELESTKANGSGTEGSPSRQLSQKTSHPRNSSAVGVKESADRLNFAFRKLLHAVTQARPLVVVCDDIQWSDQSSLDLIKSWITDIENPRLMIVGCYRSNMVDDDKHPVRELIQDIELCSEKRGIEVAQIELNDLDKDAVREMIADVLNMEQSDSNGLSDIVYNKTHGNAFFLIQFMHSLVKDDLLTFNAGMMTWTWHDVDVKERTMATNNVVDLMKNKMSKLPSDLSLSRTMSKASAETEVSD